MPAVLVMVQSCCCWLLVGCHNTNKGTYAYISIRRDKKHNLILSAGVALIIQYNTSWGTETPPDTLGLSRPGVTDSPWARQSHETEYQRAKSYTKALPSS